MHPAYNAREIEDFLKDNTYLYRISHDLRWHLILSNKVCVYYPRALARGLKTQRVG